ncbi:MAG TPA: hypothetical protein VD906_03715 [Caulobacteraceae bacterium]|nr:hypothetical protein [Caulobacteraceae bacterium]
MSPALAGGAHGKGQHVAGAFSIANAWDGRASCLQSLSQVEGRMKAELPSLLSASHGVEAPASAREQRLAYMQLRYGYDGAPRMAPSQWTAGDLGDLLVTLSDLPANAAPFDDEVLRPLVFDQHLRAGGSGQALIGGAAVIAVDEAGGIRVGAAWKKLPRTARRVAIFHELAHEFLRQRGAYFTWRPHWAAAVRADEALARQRGLGTDRVSLYATTSAEEDFAESAAAYRYMPARLKQRAPNRYKLLKAWMFDGLEYTSSQACAAGAAKSERAAKLAVKLASTAPDASSRRVRLDAFRQAWRTLTPRSEAYDIAALEGFLNSRRIGQKMAYAMAGTDHSAGMP